SQCLIQADKEALRTEFIVVGSILTVVFMLLLLGVAAFTIYIPPSSPIPPSPPESLRVTKLPHFTTLDEEDSIYEPIGHFSPARMSESSAYTNTSESMEI
ncbi:hypothetical protein PFISCL1PPCAC_1361, partial [Pristionchus fissidentatus]